MNGDYELVAGSFSRDSRASRALAAEIGLDNDRAYDSFAAMFAAEAALPDEQRVQCVAVVTPNDSHADIACAALDAGFHVICDKRRSFGRCLAH